MIRLYVGSPTTSLWLKRMQDFRPQARLPPSPPGVGKQLHYERPMTAQGDKDAFEQLSFTQPRAYRDRALFRISGRSRA